MKSLSIVIPLYNEYESLRELHEGINVELERLGVPAEIIFVDDGSTDRSLDVLKELQQSDPRIRIFRFRRNFGKSAALSAGFRVATGDIILTMDADLQDQPSEMMKLLDRLDEGADLVSGWKKKRHDPLTKTIPSRVFNAVTAFLTGVPLHDMNCGYKAYRREVIEEIRVYGEMHRYIPVLASYRGFRVAEVPIEHRARPFGRSKYGFTRLFGGFFDLLTVIMLTRYNRKPLHVFGFIGILLVGLGLAIELYLTIGWFMGRWIGDRPALMLGILSLIVGAQFIFFGLLAEMIAYSNVKQDEYAIHEVIEAEDLSRDQEALGPLKAPAGR